MKPHNQFPALLLLALAITLLPLGQAQLDTTTLYVEGFENLAANAVPSATVAGQYTYTTVGTGSVLVVSSPTLDDARALRVRPGAATNVIATFDGAGGDFCNTSGGISFSLRLDALPTSSTYKIGITGYNGAGGDDFNGATDGNTFFYLAISTTGVATMEIENNPTVVVGTTSSIIAGLTIAPDTNYHFEMTCPAEGTTGVYRIVETTTSNDVSSSVARAANGGTNAADDRFSVFTLAGQTDAFVDDISFYEDVITAGVRIFCSDIGVENFGGDADADFGYNYVEDTTAEEGGEPLSATEFEDAFRMEGSLTDYAYMGKGWSPGEAALRTYFRIEASSEGEASVFRTAYSFVSGTPSNANKGNGDNTQAFATHLAVRFREVGNDWRINLEEVLTSGGSTTELGPSFTGFNPNSPTSFSFIVDTRAGRLFIAVLDEDGNDILNQTLGGAYTDDLMHSQWFIGSDTDGEILGEGEGITYVDDNEPGTDRSTCIYALDGEAATPTGAMGSDDGFTDPDPDEDGGGDGGFFDLTDIDPTLFIGFLLVCGMVFAGVQHGVTGLGLTAFFLLGIGLGFSLGWIPLWLVLVMFVACLAAIWFLPKPSGDGL